METARSKQLIYAQCFIYIILLVIVWSYLKEILILTCIYMCARVVLYIRTCPLQGGVYGNFRVMYGWVTEPVVSIMNGVHSVIDGFLPECVDPTSRRIILLGKTGAGKSSTGNTILGDDNAFDEEESLGSVTQESTSAKQERFGRNLLVVDTPGLYDTNRTFVEVGKKLFSSISEADPGPHVFIFVVNIGAFSKEGYDAFRYFKTMLGEAIIENGILLFTHRDRLSPGETLQDYVNHSDVNSYLHKIVSAFGNRMVLFNNKDRMDDGQLKCLLNMIDDITDLGKTFLPSGSFQLKIQVLEEIERSTNLDFKAQREAFVKRMQELNTPSAKLKWALWAIGAGATAAVLSTAQGRPAQVGTVIAAAGATLYNVYDSYKQRRNAKK